MYQSQLWQRLGILSSHRGGGISVTSSSLLCWARRSISKEEYSGQPADRRRRYHQFVDGGSTTTTRLLTHNQNRKNNACSEILDRVSRGLATMTSPNDVVSKYKLALVQMAVTADKEGNIQSAIKLVRDAANQGAKVVALPECFNSPYGIQYFGEYAESVPEGKTCEAIGRLAEELKIFIVAGSVPELGADSKLYNTCCVFNRSGRLINKHRKLHLFDIDVPGRITFQESKVLSGGDSITVVDAEEFGKIGIGICYDIRFPELAQIYRSEGCSLLLYPGAFNMTTGPAHWKILNQARAVDNQVYVASIAPARDEKAGYVAWGHSLGVDPWGKVVAEAQETETVIYLDVDLEYMNQVREQIPVSRQKRLDVYSSAELKNQQT